MKGHFSTNYHHRSQNVSATQVKYQTASGWKTDVINSVGHIVWQRIYAIQVNHKFEIHCICFDATMD